MKKKLPRIMACLMACLILANTVAIPRAKASAAVVGTSALATSALASYMTATGVPLTVISGGAAAASACTASLISGYAAATGGTYSVVTTAIASGVTIGTGGVIAIGAAAAAILAGIVAWAIDHYSIDTEPSVNITTNHDGWSMFASDGNTFLYKPATYLYEDAGYMYVDKPDLEIAQNYDVIYYLQNDDVYRKVVTMYRNSHPDGSIRTVLPKIYKLEWFDSVTGELIDSIQFQYDSLLLNPNTGRWCTVTCDDEGRAVFCKEYTASESQFIDKFFDVQTCKLTSESGYKALPELSPLEQLELSPNLNPEIAPEAVPDAIFSQIASNDFASTYRVVPPVGDPEPDPEPNPDPEPDTGGDSGLDSTESIGWLKRIALACEALADKILGGIESIFAPDPALMQEISEVFMDKFGFLSTLHQLGTDLLSIDASSEPPVIYIHLEDAEGSIDYGGTVKALDMSWYARYKPDVDRIMSGFLWLGFLWLLFKRAAAIIRGAEMVSGHVADSEGLNALEMFKADHNLDDWGRPIS